MNLAIAPQRGINNKALAWTIGVHTLLLLLFFFLRYTINDQPALPDGGGYEVNLGTSENGEGDDQPMNKRKPAEFKSSVSLPPVVHQHSAIPQNVFKSEDETAPAVTAEKPKVKEQPEAQPEPPKPEPKPAAKPRFTYAGENDKGGNDAADDKKGSHEGNTSGPGDRGVPGGTPGAANYTGIPGNGTGGITSTVFGRTIFPNRFEAEFRESGTVEIAVTVDRMGNIVSRRVLKFPSATLCRLAMDKLNQVHFSKSEGSEPQQFGTVTIVFKTH